MYADIRKYCIALSLYPDIANIVGRIFHNHPIVQAAFVGAHRFRLFFCGIKILKHTTFRNLLVFNPDVNPGLLKESLPLKL